MGQKVWEPLVIAVINKVVNVQTHSHNETLTVRKIKNTLLLLKPPSVLFEIKVLI